MPAYDYYCPRCNASFEETVPVDERDNCPCPQCNGMVERQPSLFSIRGFEYTHDWGKQDPIVSYPGGVTKQKSYNELYSTGGL